MNHFPSKKHVDEVTICHFGNKNGTVGGRNPAPLYLHPKTNPRTPSLTLGQCLVVRKKEVE